MDQFISLPILGSNGLRPEGWDSVPLAKAQWSGLCSMSTGSISTIGSGSDLTPAPMRPRPQIGPKRWFAPLLVSCGNGSLFSRRFNPRAKQFQLCAWI